MLYSVYRFPSDPEIKKKWILALRRKNFQPSNSSKLCGAHFLPDDFLIRPGSYRKQLKDSAIPSVFAAFPAYYQPKPKKARSNRQATLQEENISPDPAETSCTLDVEPVPDISGHNNVSQETQTLECLLPDPADMKILKRKIRILTQKIRRRDKKIKSLKELVQSLKKQGLVDVSMENILLDQFNGITAELIKNFKKNAASKTPKGHRYSLQMKKFAITLYYHSPKAYKYCR